MRDWSLGELAERLGAELRGDAALRVGALAPVHAARRGTLSFVANPRYRAELASTQATAVIVAPALAEHCPVAALVIANPYLAYARVSQWFEELPPTPPGIDPTAVVHPQATVAASAHVGPLAVVEAGAEIGEGAIIGAQCHVGAGARIGAQVRLWPNVTIYRHVRIGQRTIIHAGTVVGADGFGYAKDGERWYRIAQLGSVQVGDDVEIGALCTIDRGAIEDTVIGNGVILDDQVHIAHNVTVGDYTAMAGKSGISGSSKVGRHCIIAGMSGLVGHIELCDNVQVSGMTAITRSIDQPGTYTGGTGMMEHGEWAKNAARFRQLDAMARRLAQLERRLKELEDPGDGQD